MTTIISSVCKEDSKTSYPEQPHIPQFSNSQFFQPVKNPMMGFFTSDGKQPDGLTLDPWQTD